MKPIERDVRAMENPEARLENALIEEFLVARGIEARALQALSEQELKHVLTAASAYATAKLAEVEARAHYVHEIHRKE